MPNPDVIVIGAGAAGIIAAWRAASLGARTVLLEKNDRIGIKILVSGGGKCNITHDGPIEEVLKAFRPNEARFIRPACYRFRNTEIVQMLNDRGLETYVRPDGRIFPVDGTAKDVVAILGSYLEDAGVDVRLNSPVKGILEREGRVIGVRTADGDLLAERVILAVGGMSYPKTGTTGDAYPWVQALGHSLVKIRAALAPIYLELEADWPETRAGVALRDCVLKARLGKEIARWRGDLLFTHHGVSGPTVLGVSRVVAERFHDGAITLEVDVAPSHTFESLTESALEFAKQHPRRSIGGWIDQFVPERMVDKIADAAGIDPTIVAGQFPAKARNRLIEILKAWPLGKVRAIPLEKGEVVAGGVPLDEVDPQTMRSLKCGGLYLCGEVLDVAGPVGGYNLQAAFATGFVAGETAAQDALASPAG